jgi:aspartate kinase
LRIFKFGGASVKDAESIQNVKTVLEKTGYQNLLVVVSAMGKTTNALEKVVNYYFNNPAEINTALREVTDFHHQILNALFPDKNHRVYEEVAYFFKKIRLFIELNKSPNHPYVYDQIVSYGELISTKIISNYLQDNGIDNRWLDSRDCIKTDSNYRDAAIDWQTTQKQIQEVVTPGSLMITQGFIGSDTDGFTTTLGREGSDYTAAIFAYCLDAQNVTIWKDVPGVLNADPREFEHTDLLRHISYREAIEMAFYGASVIHPKTLQPLQQKKIPFFVKSFMAPADPGTTISDGADLIPAVSCYIVKKNQVLISLSSRDFSFMVEDHIGEVFKLLHRYKMKVNLIQNSAISFSVCVDNKFNKLNELLTRLESDFKIQYHDAVTLLTIRHYRERDIVEMEKKYQVLLKQQSGDTVQLVVS